MGTNQIRYGGIKMVFIKIFIGIILIYLASIGTYFTVLKIVLTIDANKRIRHLKKVRKENEKWKE